MGVLMSVACLVLVGCGADTTVPTAVPPGQVELVIVAENIDFHPPEAVVPAGVPLVVRLDNRDADVPHNAQLGAGPGFAAVLATTEIVVGPATTPRLVVPGLVPGAYRFTCQVHPNMTMGLTVQASQ
jgi:plastocyanin